MRTDRRRLDGPVSSQAAKVLSSWRGRAGVLVSGALFALLLLPLLSSPVSATSFAWTSCMDGGTPDYQTASSGPVSASISCGSWGEAQASADDLAQAMASHAQGSGSTTAEEADAEARMTTTLTVLPGTSGLSFGAPVTLRFVVVAAGSASAGAAGPTNSYGYSDGTVTYKIKDAPAPAGSLIASFSASVSADTYYSSSLNSTDFLVLSAADYHNAITSDYKEYYSPYTATLPPGSGFGSDNFIDFATTVCAVLHLDAQIWEQAGGGPNIVGQLGPAGGSVTLDPVTPSFTPAPGCSCDGLELVIGTVEHPAVWRTGEVDLGGGWKWTEWLGYYNTSSEPWIYHQEHQWLYPYGDGACGVFFWYDDMQEFIWTDPATYPYLYRFGADEAWLWYLKDSADPRWFVNMATGVWEPLP